MAAKILTEKKVKNLCFIDQLTGIRTKLLNQRERLLLYRFRNAFIHPHSLSGFGIGNLDMQLYIPPSLSGFRIGRTKILSKAKDDYALNVF